MFSDLHEECGVFGIYEKEASDVARKAYYALIALQHRGEESAGIAVNKDRVITCTKDLGLVSDVFGSDTLGCLGEGNMAVGHVRYSTSGTPSKANAQPMLVNHMKGQIALTHNGNLTNSYDLRRGLEEKGCIFHTTSDTELISYIITGERLACDSVEEAVRRTMSKIEGAYSLVLMSPAKLIAARDPQGFRPLCMGTLPNGGIVFASEDCAIRTIGGKFVRDIEPGEVVVVENGVPRSLFADNADVQKTSLCIFEYIYFARPDSRIDGVSVHDFRTEAGRYLARRSPADADVVIGVPDSGLEAAYGFAEESGIPYEIGLIKNKYIGRSFIAPNQSERENKVHMKLSPVGASIEGKRVVLIDDSIVRGTTSQQIVKLVRDAGAKEVHMRSSAPPFMNPCYYGTDVDSKENLIACKYSIEGIAKFIGADSLGYMSVPDSCEILERKMAEHRQKMQGAEKESADESHSCCDCMKRGAGRMITGFCTACFDGVYPTSIPSATDKHRFEQK